MKKIDAVRMVRNIRDKQHAEIAGMNSEQLRQYFRQKSQWAFQKTPAGSATTQK